MHRAGKRHPRPAQQNLPQPASRQTGGLVHHHHLGLRLLRQQLRHRQETNRLPARQHKLRLRTALNPVAQDLRRMPEETLQTVHRRRRHQHLLPPRQQQLRRRHPQRRRLPPAPVCRHHHRPPTPPQPETHQPRHQLRLLRRRPRPERCIITPDIRQHRAFINTLPNPDHRTVRRHNLRQPRQKPMLPRPIQPRARVIRILKPRRLRQRRHQPEQQPTGPQRTRQPRKPVRRIPLPAIPNQHPGLPPQPALVLRCRDATDTRTPGILVKTNPQRPGDIKTTQPLLHPAPGPLLFTLHQNEAALTGMGQLLREKRPALFRRQ